MGVLDILDRPIAYHSCFVSFGGVTGAVMLSQAVYWQNRVTREDGFFYKSAKDWTMETGLTTREQGTARKKLVGVGVLIEKKCGVPCTVHYKVDEKRLAELLSKTSFDKSSKLDSVNPQNSVSTNPQNLISGNSKTITETTTETTNKTTADIDNKPMKPKKVRSVKFIKPTIEEVRQYCLERNNSINAEKWMDHYICNGWMVGKNKMKDWKASVRLWEQYEKPKQKESYIKGDRFQESLFNESGDIA